MLVLARRKNEGITIDHPSGPIHIVVINIRGDKDHNVVRLGIAAPSDVRVDRDEVAVRRVRAALEAGKLNELEQKMDKEENDGL